ncbi:YwiC-like family protein [Phocicoccus pinnipedialis]|uniref:YwiC-like protein n=1 Tax=Phocicoccus pinnipedialis TaxID=110845 RepID=A0A6V7RG97_9BACL|nr:YwiC-like family protein [Jeotgalicoccus pinnipedialis]MBP1939265.1 hypothetical protein [Jeotgalicoccus pinnipedialis]CAD2076096.1 hypothetical protein JEOPIN946_01174 [Jeotgalicoccus pinnipedialis]
MKFKKQNQHGAWAMVFMPPIIGILANGFNISQVLFIIGWLLIFLAADQILFFIKMLRKKQYGYIQSAVLFASIALVFFIYPFIVDYRIIYFFLTMIPFGIVNGYYAKKKDERNILNDVSAIIIFSIAGAAVSYLNAHAINFGVLFTFAISFLYFLGVTFVVKTVIREKNNPLYKYLSFGYNTFVFVCMLFMHYLLGIGFVFGMLRAIYVYGKGWTPKKLGIMEIVHACWVTVWCGIYLMI